MGPWRRPCVRPDSPQRGSTHPQPQAGGVHAKASPPATWSKPSAVATPHGIVQPAHCPSSCRETAGAQPRPCKGPLEGTLCSWDPAQGVLNMQESRPFGNSCQRIWAAHPEQHSAAQFLWTNSQGSVFMWEQVTEEEVQRGQSSRGERPRSTKRIKREPRAGRRLQGTRLSALSRLRAVVKPPQPAPATGVSSGPNQ